MRPVPNVFVGEDLNGRVKLRPVGLPHDAIDAISAYDQVAVMQRRQIRQARAKLELHTEMPTVLLENAQQCETGDPRKPEPIDPDLLSLMDNRLIVPGLQTPC